ncbi:MAG TPA: GGDEF domain-containing protein [Cellvibrionaceae bacterium]|nr:GGDEF domain-containing protein [Cellvibrionaceae bacterium]
MDFRKWYRRTMALGLIVSLVVFLGHFFIPTKRLALVPEGHYAIKLYGFPDEQLGISASWLDKEQNHWLCNYKPSHGYGCGWDVTISTTPGKGMDWTQYNKLELTMRYKGPATRLRVFLRNFNPAYANADDFESFKTMNMSFPVEDVSKPILVDLREFQVVAWWFAGKRARLEWPLPELNNITHLGVDARQVGEHDVQITSVTLLGQWIKTTTLLFWMISFWSLVFLLEGGVRFYNLYRKARDDRQAIKSMEERQRSIQEENQHLEQVTNSDPLTGIYNRTGLRVRIDALKQRQQLDGAGVMILDLDHFKKLNDRYGHDMGDKVLRTFAAMLAMNLRDEDIFARLGGEEFVVVCRRQPIEGVCAFADKLRRLASQCSFSADDDISISVSIGGAIVLAGEELSDTLKRADEALYTAKQNGRNRVEFDTRR